MIQYVQFKDFVQSLRRMKQHGGRSQKISDKIFAIWGKATVDPKSDPFHGLPLTNHGENRIKHARKYDLGDGFRLITIHDQKYCMFCYAGNHNNCDKWLERNAGLTVVKNKQNEYEPVFQTIDLKIMQGPAPTESDYLDIRLYERLDKGDQNRFLGLLPANVLADMLKMTPSNTDEEIYELASQIDDPDIAAVTYDVLNVLRAGDKNQAISRLDLHFGASKPLSELSDDELLEVNDGMSIKRLVIGSEEYGKWVRQFIDSAGYQDWMLFMHPAQEKIVNANYDGPAKLSGVSGSGKTCIVVNRAIRLARENGDKPVIILTLNKSLAALIQELVTYACPDAALRGKITVNSFFELCQSMLNEFEPKNSKLHDDVTWKLNEHIDEVWREYYRCELNVKDAMVMLPIHKSLNSQGINPEEYLRQELDWVRSAYPEEQRTNYLNTERRGRAIPLQKHQREMILSGLSSWEKKMSDIGIIDYLGLSAKLSMYIDKIAPRYSAILVDEVQDFGTVELRIIRKLVAEGKNDIFIAGDMAQHVFPKHQSFKEASLDIPGARSQKITRNYRNSREILRAAYEIFISTMQGDVMMDGEMDLLDPEYANFSTSKPLILKANTIEDEIAYAISYLRELVENDGKYKGCIAFAGYTMYEILPFAKKYGLEMLDGTTGVLDGNIFISDLEQTKGYEFDTMIILNCNCDILPPNEMPIEEQYRDSCRLYVAMTRAKKELILSYSSEDPSSWLVKSIKYFDTLNWDEVVEGACHYTRPEKMSQFTHHSDKSILAMTGTSFIYTNFAIGLSIELQDKILELVDGLGRSSNGKRIRWSNIGDAYRDVMAYPHAKQEFGVQKTWREFKELVEKHQ